MQDERTDGQYTLRARTAWEPVPSPCLPQMGQHPQWNQLSGSQSRDPASKPALAAKALLPAWIGFISVPVTCSY